MAQQIDYNKDIQTLFIEMMLNDAESYSRIQNIFNPKYFNRDLQPVAQFVKEYSDDYKQLPELEMVKDRGGRVFKVGKYFSEDYAEAVCEKYISLGLYSDASKVKVDLDMEEV